MSSDSGKPKLIEKDGKYKVIMPNGFTTKLYNSKESCTSFLSITQSVIKLTNDMTKR